MTRVILVSASLLLAGVFATVPVGPAVTLSILTKYQEVVSKLFASDLE